MRTIDIVLETLAHFVKMEGGPPPGIPVRVEPDFERKLVRLCEWHSLAPLFLDSLQKLALEAPLSDVTLERLNSLSRASAARNETYIAALRSISSRLRERRVPFLLIDDMMAALKLYPRHRLRPIERLDVLIHENDWDMFISGLRGIGYRREERDPAFEDGREAMLFHQYFSPCVLRGEREVAIGVKFRLIDVGHPAPKESAWTMGKRLGRDVEAMRLSYEDQYLRSCMAFHMTGFGRLLHAVDAGRILARHGEDLDWGYIEGRARAGSYYPSLFFAHESVVKMFQFPAKRKPLPDPSAGQKSFFQMMWNPGRVSSLTERAPTLHRYRFSFFGHGTWADRMKVAGSLVAPPKDWVSGYFGRPSNPWLAFRFTSLALRNKLSEPPTADGKPRPDAKTGRDGAAAEAKPLRGGPPREGSSREGYSRGGSAREGSRDGRDSRDGQRRDSRPRRDYGPREGGSRDGRSRRGGPPPRRPRQSPDDRPPETRPTREFSGRSERPERGDGRRGERRDFRRDDRPEDRRDDRRDERRDEKRDDRRDDKRDERRDDRRDEKRVERRDERQDDRRDERPVRAEPGADDKGAREGAREGAAQESRPPRGRRRRWTSSSRRGPEDRARRGGDRGARPEDAGAPRSEQDASEERVNRPDDQTPRTNDREERREEPVTRSDDREERRDEPATRPDDRGSQSDDAGGRSGDARAGDAGGAPDDTR